MPGNSLKELRKVDQRQRFVSISYLEGFKVGKFGFKGLVGIRISSPPKKHQPKRPQLC